MIASLVSRRAGAEEIRSLRDAVDVELALHRLRQPEHHDVVRRHQRGEGEAAAGKRAQQMLGVEALAVVDAAAGAAGGEGEGEEERVGVAHRHDQKARVVATEPEVRPGMR